MTSSGRLLFYSRYAFHPPLFEVFRILCAECSLRGHVVAHEAPDLPAVHAPSGPLRAESVGADGASGFITALPKEASLERKWQLLKQKLGEIRPDYIWAHEEPNDFFVNCMLRRYYFERKPRIVVPVVENIWPVGDTLGGHFAVLRRRILWRRLDGVLAAARKSIGPIRGFGMPPGVPIVVAWQPQLAPPSVAQNNGLFLPAKREGEIFVGFAGRITAAKGWRVLLAAMQALPENFTCLLAGSGEEEAELRAQCASPALRHRAHFLGLLKKDQLWPFYRALDLFVLPSLTTPSWMEQFGSVLAEAMACGVPVIGSDSGAIPEVIGDAGVVVGENDPRALAEAIEALASDPKRRKRLGEIGRQKFAEEYSCAAYAAKVAQALGLTSGGASRSQ